MFAQNIDFGYMLELAHRGGSNEYPQFMFWNKYKKNRYTPVKPFIKVGFKGVYFSWKCSSDEMLMFVFFSDMSHNSITSLSADVLSGNTKLEYL